MATLTVKHSDFNHYIINLHTHHNTWRLQKVLLRQLTAPVPYTSNHRKLHEDAACELPKKNTGKQEAAATKTKATKEQNKKESEVEGHGEPGHPEAVVGS